MSELERVVRADYLGDLSGRAIDELRTMRTECQSVETGLSYLRRLVQGRMDILAEESRRRAGGDVSTEDLIARLPEILSDRSRMPGNGRLPSSLDTGDVDPELQAQLDDAVSPTHLSALGELSDEEMEAATNKLGDLERTISDHRRALFERLDALQAEIARRYRTGEASVESLLQ